MMPVFPLAISQIPLYAARKQSRIRVRPTRKRIRVLIRVFSIIFSSRNFIIPGLFYFALCNSSFRQRTEDRGQRKEKRSQKSDL